MDKIAAEAAQRIAQDFHDQVREHYEPDVVFMAKIIESALSQSLAARDKEIEELAARWDSDAEVREASDAKQWARNFRVDTRVLRDCATELRALLKGKAI